MKSNGISLFLAIVLPLCTGLLLLSSCEKTGDMPEDHPMEIILSTEAYEVVASSNHFGIDLFRRVAIEENDNLMLSPLSASIALTMLLNGSQDNTYEQIKYMLGYPEDMSLVEINETYQTLVKQLIKADKRVMLTLANAIFYRDGFQVKPPFLAAMREDFDARVEALDFSQPAALAAINKWANDNTNGKIPKVLDEISPATVMFLMNALYFKGEWSSQFKKSETTDRPFLLDDGSSVMVSTMHGEVDAISYYEQDHAILEMPYGRKNFSMVVVVPQKPLHAFLPELNNDWWQNISAVLAESSDWPESMVAMPKFKFDYEKVLNDHLMAMGMTDAYDATKADFSVITDAGIFVDFVKQNTFVEVNEEGTEAAAVTTVAMQDSAPAYFEVNKPFIFIIRERTTNTLLFIGCVKDPR